MHLSTPFVAVAFAGLVAAQSFTTTPEGFVPQVRTLLDVSFNSTSIDTPGKLVAKSAVATQPQLGAASTVITANGTFIFVMLDIDVPPTAGNSTRRVLLHAMVTDFRETQQKINGTDTALASASQGPAPYIPPNPPATDAIAHRYIQLLFTQPAGFAVPALNPADTLARFNFDITSFISKNGLSAPVAANFFRVDGRATATANSSSTAGVLTPTNTLAPFVGPAGKTSFAHELAVLCGALVVFMVM